MDEENDDILPVEDHQEQGEAPGEEADVVVPRALYEEVLDAMYDRVNREGAGTGLDRVEIAQPLVIDNETHEFFLQRLVRYLRGNEGQLPFYWHEVIRQGAAWDESHLRQYVEVARSSSRCFVELEPMCVGDQAAAARTMQIVRSFPDLEHLALGDSRSERFERGRPDDVYTAQRVNWLLDAFQEQQMTAGAPPSKLSAFTFECDCPVRPSSLVGFLESVSSTLTTLNYGEFGTESLPFNEDLARALSGVFSRLPRLKRLQLCLPISGIMPIVIDGLVPAADLENLCIVLYDGYHPRPTAGEARESILHAIRQVASLTARFASLRDLGFVNRAHYGVGVRYNAAAILLHAAASTSLETVYLLGISVRCAKSLALGEKSWNESVKSIHFERCKLGVGTFELLSRFKGITSIEFTGCIGLPRAGKCHWLLSKLPCLKSFTLEQDCDDPAVTRDSTVNSIARAGHSFDRLKIALGGGFEDYHDRSFPSLQSLMLRTAGTLQLSLESNDSDEFLMAGIKGTTTLQNLYIRHTMAPTALAELFKSVQVNTSLRSFGCEVGLPDREANQCVRATCSDSLTDMLRLNKVLRSISVHICSYDIGTEDTTSTMLHAIINGLYTNQSIETLEWREGLLDFSLLPDSSAMLAVLKHQNTVLKRIKGYNFMEYGGEDIGYYLWMNRSGRHFVRNSHLMSPSLLPYILSAIGKDTGEDGIRYFLRNMPPDRLARILSARGIRRTRPASFDD